MTVQIALLKAVNVSGSGKIAMADLRARMANLGFADVKTVLQSGNLVFTSHIVGGAEVEERLESDFRKSLKLQTTVMLRSAEQWRELVAGNPFPDESKTDPSHLLAVFAKITPTKAAIDAMYKAIAAKGGRESARVVHSQIYLAYPDGIGDSKVTTALLERALGTSVTARNWNTVLKISELAIDVSPEKGS